MPASGKGVDLMNGASLMGRVPNLTGACPTVELNDMIMRSITGPEELALFNRLPYVLNEELAGDLAHGRRQPEWMWVALRGDRLLARAAWWARPGGDTPFLLDILDVEDSLPAPARMDIGGQLVRTAMAATLPAGSRPPGFSRFVPPNWRDSAVTRDVVQDRMTILEHTGYIDDLLAEGTRVLCEQDAPRIRATTDVGNVPMAKAFQRAGYVNFEREINMTWS
jgi:hypothetical protein